MKPPRSVDEIAVEPFGAGIARVNLSLAARVRQARGIVCWEGVHPFWAHLRRTDQANREARHHAPEWSEEVAA